MCRDLQMVPTAFSLAREILRDSVATGIIPSHLFSLIGNLTHFLAVKEL